MRFLARLTIKADPELIFDRALHLLAQVDGAQRTGAAMGLLLLFRWIGQSVFEHVCRLPSMFMSDHSCHWVRSEGEDRL